MARLAATVFSLALATVSFAAPPMDTNTSKVSVYPVYTTPVLDGTVVPATGTPCPTACDTNCDKPKLVDRLKATYFSKPTPKCVVEEPKCVAVKPCLTEVMARPLPIAPTVAPTCTECVSTGCTNTQPLWKGMSRFGRTTSCETKCETPCEKTCSTGCGLGCWAKLQAWLTFRSCPSGLGMFRTKQYQPSVYRYVGTIGHWKDNCNAGGCGNSCGATCGSTCTKAGNCSTGACLGAGLGINLLHRNPREARDCTGATQVDGTPFCGGFRFAHAEQLKLPGGNAGLPVSQASWPAETATPLEAPGGKPAPAAPVAPKTMPMPMGKATPAPTAKPTIPMSTTSAHFQVNKPFTNP